MREKEREFVRERERERVSERERASACERARERERECVCDRVCVCVRERESVSVCERARKSGRLIKPESQSECVGHPSPNSTNFNFLLVVIWGLIQGLWFEVYRLGRYRTLVAHALVAEGTHIAPRTPILGTQTQTLLVSIEGLTQGIRFRV